MLETLGHENTPRGELKLHRKTSASGFASYELLVNGDLVMDSGETESERLLATSALRRLEGDQLRIMVGGLGLGFTVAELLTSTRVGTVEVIEVEPTVVDWIRDGLVPDTAEVLQDPRVRVRVEDVLTAVSESDPGTYDAILLDVDNGPDHLLYELNAELYQTQFCTACDRALRPGGLLSVWSAQRAPAFQRLLHDSFGSCEEIREDIRQDGTQPATDVGVVIERHRYLYLARSGRD